jgi:hypothetical protein
VGNEDLFGTVISHLPKGVDLRYISAHVRIRCALNSSWGETYLLLHKAQLVLLTRSSVFDPYEVVELSDTREPELSRGTSQSDLFVQALDGTEHRLPVAPAEIEAVEKVLGKYRKLKQEGT